MTVALIWIAVGKIIQNVVKKMSSALQAFSSKLPSPRPDGLGYTNQGPSDLKSA